MARTPQLVDHLGRPVRRAALTREAAAPTLGSVRSPLTGTPGDGLDPQRLADILRAADRGDPVRYLELAEVIEERNPHYLGVLGTRRRAVSQIPITVEPASDAAADAEKAEMVQKWLKRQELQLELFDILDSIGKGFSFTEIIWETSMGQWRPQRLEYRDPRWFRFDRRDLATPRLLDEQGREIDLPPFQFIFSRMQAKSGLPLRSGIARAVMWGHMFKLYSERDWQIFIQTYGQPLRVGKWGAGATETDKNTLFQAVANIAGDCAAIIPESMQIDFVEGSTLTASSDLYKDRADWLDQQVSKAVLGQTATTDAVTGGLGSGKEHREVQEDIETADCTALSAIINRDLVRPWIDLEYGKQEAYPEIKIGRPEPEDVAALTSALGTLVPLGLKVGTGQIYTKLGLTPPEDDDEILGQMPQNDGADADQTGLQSQNSIFKHQSSPVKHLNIAPRPETPESSQARSTGRSAPHSPVEEMTDILMAEAEAEIGGIAQALEAMLQSAESIDAFRGMVVDAFPHLNLVRFEAMLAEALTAGHGAGAAQVAEEDG